MTLDHDLKRMMQERTESVSAAPTVPERTARRVRVRKALQAGGASLAVVTIAVVGILAVRSAVWTDASPLPPADRDERSATVIAEGSAKIRSSAVFGLCEYLFANCTKAFPDDRVLTIQVFAEEVDGRVMGSGSIRGGGLDDTFTVRCSQEFVKGFTAVGGTFETGDRAGEGLALYINDLDPDHLAIWFEDASLIEKNTTTKEAAIACGGMFEGVRVRGPDNLQYEELQSGDFTLGQ